MSAYSLTIFLEPHADVRGGASPSPVLHVEPDGRYGPGRINFQFRNDTTLEDQVKIAESFLKGVTDWRDTIVAEFEQQRTAADELEEARAEIARLKGEAGDAS
ncbi:hypothetical protein ACFQ6Q_04250 [Streptomyces sp. NPDC056437]|uniref:hypothetical protein n=1 Tax=Streptomyces sp. NPDC056437 TaxID=3345816 RepID=UPI003678B31E